MTTCIALIVEILRGRFAAKDDRCLVDPSHSLLPDCREVFDFQFVLVSSQGGVVTVTV